MNDDSELVDYIRDVRLILADSIDALLNLEYDINDEEETISPIHSVVELVDMSYDVAQAEKIKQAQSSFLEREPF